MQFKKIKSLEPVLLFLILFGTLSSFSCRKKQTGPPPQIPQVTVTAIQPQQTVLTTELPGRTSPYRISEIRPQVNGLIQKRLFTEGSDVNAGQVLYQIDPAPFEAVLNNAKAALDKAQAILPSLRSKAQRYQELLADKAVSQQDYDDALSALNQAEADNQFWKATAQTAEINLGYTKVLAPISGRIGMSSVTDGAIVTAYQAKALATIQQLDPIYVDVPQSTTELLNLNRRMQAGDFNQNGATQKIVKLLMEDGTPYPLDGTLQFRDITVDPATGSVTLRIVFPNPKGALLPGMFVRAIIEEGIHENAMLVPQQAVSRDLKGNPMALIVDANNIVQPRMLTLDRAIGDKWLLTSGLAPGDRVIIEGLQKVRPGIPVTIGSPENKDVNNPTTQPRKQEGA